MLARLDNRDNIGAPSTITPWVVGKRRLQHAGHREQCRDSHRHKEHLDADLDKLHQRALPAPNNQYEFV